MSYRGRGRGGYGRGRGGFQEVEDEDGQRIGRDNAGPPLTFPDIDTPIREDPSEESNKLKDKWRALTDYWKRSPYLLKLVESESGTKRKLEDFLGNGVSKDRLETGRLAKVLTLDPKYFPEEIYTSFEKGVSTKASSSAAQKRYWAAMSQSMKDTGAEFDRLVEMGAQGEDINDTDATDTADAKEDDEKKAEDEDEEEQDFDIDEEEAKADTLADNDYFQAAHNDDDEGYEDDYGDDGDDGGGGESYY